MTTKKLGQITNKSLVFCLLVFLSLVFCPSTFTLFQFKDDKLKKNMEARGDYSKKFLSLTTIQWKFILDNLNLKQFTLTF